MPVARLAERLFGQPHVVLDVERPHRAPQRVHLSRGQIGPEAPREHLRGAGYAEHVHDGPVHQRRAAGSEGERVDAVIRACPDVPAKRVAIGQLPGLVEESARLNGPQVIVEVAGDLLVWRYAAGLKQKRFRLGLVQWPCRFCAAVPLLPPSPPSAPLPP